MTRFPCNLCEKSFSSESEITEHNKECYISRCDECDETFQSGKELQNHVNSVHENKGNKRLRGDTSIQEPEISCNVCIYCEDVKKEN